jgi:HEAT repeat protein
MTLATVLLLALTATDAPPAHAGRPLAEWLKDLDSPDEKVQHAAVVAVGKMGPKAKAAVPQLVAILKADPRPKPSFWMDNAAADALGVIGPGAKDAVPALVARLTDAKRSPRFPLSAGDALARIDGPRPEAARALLLETNVRCGGLLLFFADYPRTHPVETTRHLIDLTRDADETVRVRAVGVLAGDNNLVGAAPLKASDLRAKAGPVAKEVPDAVEKLLADPAAKVRLAAARALLATAPDRADAAVAVVVAAMRAGEFRMKKAAEGTIAAEMLRPVPAKAFAALLPALDDPDAAFRGETIAVLSHLPVVPQLEQALREGKTARTRAGAANALGRSYSARSLPALIAALKDDAFEVRYAAAVAIVAVSPREPSAAVPVLVEALAAESADVRAEAAYVVRRVGSFGKPAAARLKERTRDPELRVRVAAGLALVAVDPRDAAEAVAPLTEALDPKFSGDRAAVARALAEIGPAAKPAVPALWAVCKNSASNVRAGAAEAIARIDPEQAEPAVEVLVRMVTEKVKGPPVGRVYAIESLRRVGPPAKAAVPALCDLLKDPKAADTEVALAAVAIDPVAATPALDWIRAKLRNGPKDEDAMDVVREMAKLGPAGKPLVRDMVGLLKSPDEFFRLSAARALGGVGPAAADALPALREAARADASEGVRNWAAAAVKKIEAK